MIISDIDVDIQNFTQSQVDENFVKNIVRAALTREKISEKSALYVIFVGRNRMQALNKKHRNKNKVTDVLSFKVREDFVSPPSEGKFLGEILICPPFIKKQARRLGVSFEKELAHVLIHGVFHLLGHEHEHSDIAQKKMHEREVEVMNSIKI